MLNSEPYQLAALFSTLDMSAKYRYLFELMKSESRYSFDELYPLGINEFRISLNSVLSILGKNARELSLNELSEVCRIFSEIAYSIKRDTPLDVISRNIMRGHSSLVRSDETFMLLYLYAERFVAIPNYSVLTKRRKAYFLHSAERETGGSFRAHGDIEFSYDPSAEIFKDALPDVLSEEECISAFFNSRNEILSPSVALLIKSVDDMRSLIRFLLINFGLESSLTSYEIIGSLLLLFREIAEATLRNPSFKLSTLYKSIIGRYSFLALYMPDQFCLVRFYFEIVRLNEGFLFEGKDDYIKLCELYLSYCQMKAEKAE